MQRPVILIGMPGAGKTTVAPLAAALLGTTWCDIDQRVATRAGMTVPEIFARDGEARFRDLERAEMELALGEGCHVIATGGGWAVQPGNIGQVAGRALLIYLAISPAEAELRLRGASDRPLLAGVDRLARLTELLDLRERWYRLADMEIAAGGVTPDAVAAGVESIARHYGGW